MSPELLNKLIELKKSIEEVCNSFAQITSNEIHFEMMENLEKQIDDLLSELT